MEVASTKQVTHCVASEPTTLATGFAIHEFATKADNSEYGLPRKAGRIQSSSFECDSSAMDAILGLRPNGNFLLRVDNAGLPRPSHLYNRDTQVYAPIEFVLANNNQRDGCSNPRVLSLEQDPEFKRERLLRLLDQQQAWYDAKQRVALAAEQLLTLCEHHQQQWLLPNQQIQTTSPTHRS